MTEALTRTRIAAMMGEINGVRTAFAQIPRGLQDAQLPAAVVFPGQATHDRNSMGEQLVLETRVYKIVLYIANASFDTSGQGEINADPFFDDVLAKFAGSPGLELKSEGVQQSYSVLQTELLTDGGLQVGAYPIAGQGSPDYVQIQWDLQVQEIVQVNYSD